MKKKYIKCPCDIITLTLTSSEAGRVVNLQISKTNIIGEHYKDKAHVPYSCLLVIFIRVECAFGELVIFLYYCLHLLYFCIFVVTFFYIYFDE